MPGALDKGQVRELNELGLVTMRGAGRLRIGACSVDLSLSDEGYLLKRGSVKPSTGYPFDSILKKQSRMAERLSRSPDGSFLLERRNTYVFKLRERLDCTLANANIHGQATAKSSIGRLDVLARLIVDGMDTYESFDPRRLKQSTGDMYIEITPITFNVSVRPRLHMTQLRLFYGRPEDSIMSGAEIFKTVLGPEAKEGILTVNLTDESKGGVPVAAYRAKTSGRKEESIRLWVKQKEVPWQYWRFVRADGQKRLQIENGRFYILRSKERLYVPKGIAIYCKASDETIGEMRIHYAGFVHPGFGMKRGDGLRGTPLIFEVRGHQVNANLKDGEKMANLIFYRMSRGIFAEMNKSYNDQNLKLSNVFKEWPKKLKIDSDGNVQPS